MIKRKTFIIIGVAYEDEEEQALKMEKCANMYQNFFRLGMGGAWEEDEICILTEPNISDLEQITNQEEPDYVVIVFIGHGANQDDRQLFHLNKNTVIQAGQFTLNAPKQLIIVESCRNIKENIEFVSIEDRISKFQQGRSFPPAPISREDARERFDTELSKTEYGTSICFACSKDESAFSFFFSNSLLYNSMQWHEKTNQQATLSIEEIMKPTIKVVKDYFKLNYNKEQLPELIGKGDFPFVVNKY